MPSASAPSRIPCDRSKWHPERTTLINGNILMLVNVDANKAYIFRIVHRNNISGILDSGLQCRNKATTGVYTDIGNRELIDKRSQHRVPIPPGGTLSDYIPFYFTYASPMLYNINTGYGITRRLKSEIIFLVTTIHHLIKHNHKFLFTDRHALLAAAQFFDDLNYLDRIDWDILQQRDFKRDPNDPGKLERYQAEVLVHREVPLSGLLGFACYDGQVEAEINEALAMRNINLPVRVRPNWYF